MPSAASGHANTPNNFSTLSSPRGSHASRPVSHEIVFYPATTLKFDVFLASFPLYLRTRAIYFNPVLIGTSLRVVIRGLCMLKADKKYGTFDTINQV